GYYRHEICCTFAVLFSIEGSQALILLHFSAQGLQGRDGIWTFFRLYPSISRPLRPCPKIEFFAFTSLSTELH
nr:hypothetical protein [Clostridia bacterium]